MMDEQLIDEVALHGVIFNRQKYYLNGGSGGGGAGKYETKDEAWQIIAMKLRTDVETCKKRWKYLRERYVSQRKQGDPPVYEHLSRPYLEKMKFLDQHIQPRKSYRNVPSFLTSPHSANSSNYSEYNMDSKSNGSNKNMSHFGNTGVVQHHYHQQQDQHPMNALSSAAAAASAIENANGQVKIEADQVFRDFAAAVASQQLQQISQSQMHHQAAAVAAAMADSSQNYHEHYRDNTVGNLGVGNNTTNGAVGAGIPSSSSSMKSPLSSPLSSSLNGTLAGQGHSTSTPQQVAAHSSSNQIPSHGYNDTNNDDLDSSTGSNFNMKKPRVQISSQTANMSHTNNNSNNNSTTNAANSHFVDDSDDDSDDNSTNLIPPQTILNNHQDSNHFNTAPSTSNAASMTRSNNNNNNQQGMFPSNADFLFQLYQQLPHQQQTQSSQQSFNKFSAPQSHQQRCSEHLLGELVTTELLKMSKERRKTVQRRILEILFFDD
ncbi:putative uncharacterized protein DDB_G0277255 [Teleopsis dalmanni]|uniref:putative uncharacterized protein DDB_G0277255 n=1 Tax=Teleopsis dalmanni TaxID=139649 RepID=UPI0018CF52D6|nr:putative uncharacterized protein DDB_G0277255 [Teleopsis dalmanni]